LPLVDARVRHELSFYLDVCMVPLGDPGDDSLVEPSAKGARCKNMSMGSDDWRGGEKQARLCHPVALLWPVRAKDTNCQLARC